MTQALLLKKGLSFSSHKAVISAFGEHFIKKGQIPREYGKELNRTFEKRQLGDYEYNFVILEEEAKTSLKNGKMFVEEITKHLNPGGE